MLRRLIKILLQRPGLVILIVLLFFISLVSLKPDFYLAGWDNYSSYFNLKTSIFQTLFATWREFRGLGVPSDAEVTDIFRQFFYLLASVVVPENMLDQVYYMLALWIGVLSMYGLAKIILEDFFFKSDFNKDRYSDLFGAVAGFFYLFNLNTLSVFYSPIIPFTNRFYSLPLMMLIFLIFIKKRNLKSLFWLIIVLLIASGSYITPTLLITTLIALFVFLLFKLDFKKTVLYGSLYLLINAFWIFPFINYTVEKSSIIPLASTFVEINESTLNRNPSTFSFESQATLYPSFVDIGFASINKKPFTIHPLLFEYKNYPFKLVLWIFPILYFFGSVLMFFNRKKHKKVLWIPFWILIFLILSVKEYSVLGFIFIWLKKIVPFFEIIFRISDTKFHAYISLAGSLAAAYAVLTVISLLDKRPVKQFLYTVLILIGFSYAWLFRSYFNGNLIGFYVYTKIPAAYFEIAKVINQDTERGRVLHLPINQQSNYWRPFSWGYLGSSFYNYLVKKPYIDKTFEPASQENAYFHTKNNYLLDKFYRSTDPDQKKDIAEEYLKMIRKTGVQYVLVDESITSEMSVRNIVYTAKQSYIKSKALFDYLENNQEVQLLHTYPINLQELYKDYTELYPVNKIGLPDKLPAEALVFLYKISDIRPVFSLSSAAINIDPNLGDLLEVARPLAGDKTLLQEKSKPAQINPFVQQKHQVTRSDNKFSLSFSNPVENLAQYEIRALTNPADSNLIDVYANYNGQKLNLNFYHRYFPDINEHQFKNYIGSVGFTIPVLSSEIKPDAKLITNWEIDTSSGILDTYRLKINDIYLPLPADISTEETYISSILLHENNIRTTLLQKKEIINLNPADFFETDPSSCYGSQLDGYKKSVDGRANDTLILESENGSLCVQSPLILPESGNEQLYFEIEMEMKGHRPEPISSNNNLKPLLPLVKKALTELGKTPVQAYVCVKEGIDAECLNLHRHLKLAEKPALFRIPLDSYLTGSSATSLEIESIPALGFKQKIDTGNISEHIYTPVEQSDREIYFSEFAETINVNGPKLVVSFPKMQSAYSYFHHPKNELMDYSQIPCHDEPGNIRTTVNINDTLFNYMDFCDLYVAQKFNFIFGHPYIFIYDYWLGSGQQPNIVIGPKSDNYILEKTSLYQGYPHLPGMKEFQDPQMFASYGTVKKQLSEVKLTTASRLLDPWAISSTAFKNMTANIAQDTDNASILAFSGFDMVEYPSSWYYLTLTAKGADRQYDSESGVKYKQLLPSLWSVEIEKAGQQRLLIFNEGYDRQWGIYDNLVNGVLGRTSGKNIRCDGYANCFELANNVKQQKYYIFYWPEMLNILGWILSLSGAVLLNIFFVKRLLK